jgi:DNA invertase Pin-like site-specific DNA recombinase
MMHPVSERECRRQADFHIFAAASDFERSHICGRQYARLAAARARGAQAAESLSLERRGAEDQVRAAWPGHPVANVARR